MFGVNGTKESFLEKITKENVKAEGTKEVVMVEVSKQVVMAEGTKEIMMAEETKEDVKAGGSKEKPSVAQCVLGKLKVNLQETLPKGKETELRIKSNDLFLPPLKQLGDSLNETKEHFLKSGNLFVAVECETLLRTTISDLLEKNDWFLDYDLLSRRSIKPTGQVKPAGLVYITNTMCVPFCIPPQNYCKDDIRADVIVILPNQPVFVLTILKKEGTKDISLYNTSIARGISLLMGRFMDEGLKVAFGVVIPKILEDPSTFRSCLEEIATSSSEFVTCTSMTMDEEKYDKVLTAFWASMTETKCVDDEACIRFLTKDQSVVLVENISRSDVEFYSSGCTGTTVLLAEMSRRLSHYGKTLFLCEKKEDLEKYKKLLPKVTTCTDLTGVEVEDYKCIVDETAKLELTGSAAFHWKRHYKDERSISENDKETNQKKQRLSAGGCEGLGMPSSSTVHEADNPNSSILHTNDKKVHLPLMEFNESLVNTQRCHITDDKVLVNTPLQRGRKPDSFKRFWGTCASLPSIGGEVFYWEVHSQVLPKNPDTSLADDTKLPKSWEPLMETGLVKISCRDKRVWTFQEVGSVCLLLRGCQTHNKFCLQIIKNKVDSCTDEQIDITNNGTFNYGILYDRCRSIIAFRNTHTGKFLGSVAMETDEELLPVFAVTYLDRKTVVVKMKLVCGSSINVTKDLLTFFSKNCGEKTKM